MRFALALLLTLYAGAAAYAQQPESSVPPSAPPVAASPAPAPVQEEQPPQLAELLALKLENHALRTRVAQLEIQQQERALTMQRTELEAEIVKQHPGWRMDWQTGRLTKQTTEQANGPPTR